MRYPTVSIPRSASNWPGSLALALAIGLLIVGSLRSLAAEDHRLHLQTPNTAWIGHPDLPQSAAVPELVADTPIGDSSRSEMLDVEAEAWVQRTLTSLSLRQRVGQLIMPWVPGQAASPSSADYQRMLRWVEKDEVGGLIISRGPPDAILSRLNRAQSRARVPLLITADLESGPAMRISPGGTAFPPGMAFAAANDLDLAREAGRITGIEARAVGIHMTLGPILDVNSNPLNPIINIRSFGEDPDQVGRLASAWSAGAREAGLLAAGKHFPGHGETILDSHVGLPTLSLDSARLDTVEIAPFRQAIDGGIAGILVGHIAVTGLDGPMAPPASLSGRIVGDVLRARLGFHGLVVTDALNMGAITRNYSINEASILAILAGVDVLLQPPGPAQVIDAIVAAVEVGRIPAERIEEAARRVLSAKAAAGLHRGDARADPALARQRVGTGEHREVARVVSAASMTLVRDEQGLVPLTGVRKRILHLTYSAAGTAAVGGTLSTGLREGGWIVEQVRVTDRLSAAEARTLRDKARTADLILASALVSPRENRPLTVGSTFAQLVQELGAAGKPVIAVSLGSPYLLNSFPSVSTYLLAWSASESAQRAAANALLGSAPVNGRLPVSINPYHAIGEGLYRPADRH